MSNFGGIELVFPAEVFGIQSQDQLIEDQKVTNLKSGIVTEYDLGHTSVRGETFTATINLRNGPIQTLSFARGEECILTTLAGKDLDDYCTWAILNVKKGMLYLKWNRKQKPRKTLVCATYWAGE